jgi:aldehyde:ferredoxin oxidoreductase
MFPDGHILEIDLSNQTIQKITLPGHIYRLYPGGSSLATYLLLQQLAPGTPALSPENILVFAVSPLTGLPISGISRMVVASKSPLTGGIGDSQSGGFFPMRLKANGYDAVVVKGKAEKPVFILIDQEEVVIKSAESIWGKVTGDSEKILREELAEDDLEIAQIGPGGENLVSYACILSMCSRANGRTGMGAVMGSKNLKAIVLKKGEKCKPADAEGFISLAKEAKDRLKNNDAVSGLADVGTAGDLEEFNNIGFLVTNNWQSGFSGTKADNITGETMKETILEKRDTCYACAVRCKRVVNIENLVDPLYGGPEYETVATFGSYCGIYDLEVISQANQLCNMHGLDTISCGATIAFAMECFERGLISEADTEGLTLRFGDSDSMLTLIERIAYREGPFANMLAEGSKKAGLAIGQGAEKYSMSVKGEEMAAHMPQYKPGLGVIYAVNPFGPDHQSSENDPVLMMPDDSQERVWLGKLGILENEDETYGLDDNKVQFAFDSQCFYSTLDTLCLCQFVWGPTWQLYGPDEMVRLCKTGLDWDTSLFELMRIGERRINMMRVFNAREGFTRAEDKLPARMFEKLKDGPSAGIAIDEKAFNTAVDHYYQMAGWNEETGNPEEGTLRRLSLGWLIKQ